MHKFAMATGFLLVYKPFKFETAGSFEHMQLSQLHGEASRTLKTMVAGEEQWCDRLNLLWQGTRTWNCRGSLVYSSATPAMYSLSRVAKTLFFTLNVLEQNKNKLFSCYALLLRHIWDGSEKD